MGHSRGYAKGAASQKACIDRRERWSAMQFCTPGMREMLTWYSARKNRVRTKTVRSCHLQSQCLPHVAQATKIRPERRGGSRGFGRTPLLGWVYTL